MVTVHSVMDRISHGFVHAQYLDLAAAEAHVAGINKLSAGCAYKYNDPYVNTAEVSELKEQAVKVLSSVVNHSFPRSPGFRKFRLTVTDLAVAGDVITGRVEWNGLQCLVHSPVESLKWETVSVL